MKCNRAGGFTLVEVLIAAVILFTSLAFVADLYKGSSLISDKVAKNATYYQNTPIFISTITTELRKQATDRKQANFQGQFVFSGTVYRWQAVREKFESRAIELSDVTPPRNQFSLFNVTVNEFSDNGFEQDGNTKSFSFKVNTW